MECNLVNYIDKKKNNKNQYQSYNSSITKENNINEIESNFASIQVDENGKLTSPNIVRNENINNNNNIIENKKNKE